MIFTGIIASIGGFFATFASTALGGFLLNTVAGLALSYLSQLLLAKKPKKPEFAISGKIEFGDDVPRSIMLGRGMTAGSLVYHGTWTLGRTPNNMYVRVIALSDRPVNGLTRMWINDEEGEILWGSAHPEYGAPISTFQHEGNDYMWVRFYDGSQTSSSPYLVDKFSGDPDYPWELTAVGAGVAYAIVTCRIQEELYSGFPEFKFELLGGDFYDVRKDSTKGGSGAHRSNNPATWEYSDNPFVITYTLLMGIYQNGRWLYGLQGLSTNRLPTDVWTAAMDVSDTLTRVANNGNSADWEKLYRVGGEVQTDVDTIRALEALMTTCEGRIAEVGGFYKPAVGAPLTSVFTISDADIVITEEQTFEPFQPLSDRVTTLVARYPRPDKAYNYHIAPERTEADLLELTNGRKLVVQLDYNLLPYPNQVQRVTTQQLREYGRQRRHQIMLPPEFSQQLEPVDYITWNSDRNGYEGKRFRVEAISDHPNLDGLVQIVEDDPSDYDFDYTDLLPDPAPVVVVRRPPPQYVENLDISAVTLLDSNGIARRVGIRILWDPDVQDVTSLMARIRLFQTGEVVYRGSTYDVHTGEWVIVSNLVPDEDYEVQVRFVPASDREAPWSSWTPVHTPNVQLVPALDLPPNSIVNGLLGIDAVGPDNIIDGAVLTNAIANNAVTSTKVQDLAISAAKLQDAAVVAAKIGPLAVTEAAIANLAISSGKLMDDAVIARTIGANAILAVHISANAVTAEKIAAGAITVRSLFVTDFSNLNLNPQFAYNLDGYATSTGWTRVARGGTGALATAPTNFVAEHASALASSAVVSDLTTGVIPVRPGEVFYIYAEAAAETAGGTFAAYGRRHMRDGSSGPVTLDETALTTAWQSAEGKYIVPPDCVGLTFGVRITGPKTGKVWTTNLIARRAMSGELVVDGSIAANHIQSDSIYARHLIIADLSNLVPEADLKTAETWSLSTSFTREDNTQSTGLPALRSSGTVGTVSGSSTFVGDAISKAFSVQEGEEYALGADVDATSGTTGEATVHALFYDAGGGALAESPWLTYDLSTTASIVTLSDIVTAPAGAVTARLRLRRGALSAGGSVTGTVDFRKPFFRKAADGKLIVDGAVAANHIQARSITASKLQVGSNANVYPDFDMLDNSFYTLPSGAVLGGTSVSYNGARQIAIPGNATRQDAVSELFTLEQSTDYRWTGVNRGPGAQTWIRLLGTNADGSTYHISWVALTGSDVSGRQLQSFTTTAATTRAYMLFRNESGAVGTTAYFSACSITKKASADLIVDGAIQAQHLAVDSIEAVHIKANSIVTDKLAVNSVATDKIIDEAVTESAAASASGNTSVISASGSEITVASVTVNGISGKRFFITATCFVFFRSDNTGNEGTCSMFIFRDKGGVLTNITPEEFMSSTSSSYNPQGKRVTHSTSDSPGAGTVTYRLMLRKTNSRGDCYANSRSIYATMAKR